MNVKFYVQEYNFGLAQYFGAGIMACIRGTRIFDSLETKSIVKKWIQFYKVNCICCRWHNSKIVKHGDAYKLTFISFHVEVPFNSTR